MFTETPRIPRDIALIGLWGVIHSCMARSGFKRWLTRFVPEPADRPTYMLVAGVTSALLIGLW